MFSLKIVLESYWNKLLSNQFVSSWRIIGAKVWSGLICREQMVSNLSNFLFLQALWLRNTQKVLLLDSVTFFNAHLLQANKAVMD